MSAILKPDESKVCSEHFLDSDFVVPSRKKGKGTNAGKKSMALKEDAFPMQNLPHRVTRKLPNQMNQAVKQNDPPPAAEENAPANDAQATRSSEESVGEEIIGKLVSPNDTGTTGEEVTKDAPAENRESSLIRYIAAAAGLKIPESNTADGKPGQSIRVEAPGSIPDLPSELSMPFRRVKIFTCGTCGYTSNSKDYIMKHVDRHRKFKICQECGGNCKINEKYLHQCEACGWVEFKEPSPRKVVLAATKPASEVKKPVSTVKKPVSAVKKPVPTQQRTADHRKRYSQEILTCQYCEKVFQWKHTFLAHERLHTGERPYKCTTCGEAFHSARKLSSHTGIHGTEERLYKCKTCGQEFDTARKLNRHTGTHEGVNPAPCTYCGKTFSTRYGLRKHLMIHTGERPYQCETCGDRFRQVQHLSRHQQIHDPNFPKETHQCDICGKTYSSKQSMTDHRNGHTGEKIYECNVCHKTFRLRIPYMMHRRTQHPETKPYKCEECGDSFFGKTGLELHSKRIHSSSEGPKRRNPTANRRDVADSEKSTGKSCRIGKRLYECEVCGKIITSKASLQAHLMIHTGERPFLCLVCGKGFRIKNSLDVHTMSHTGETPFPCTICGKAFSTRERVKRHGFVNHNIGKYKCDECGKSYGYKSDLLLHKRVHRPERPYKCQLCGRGFISTGELNRHRKKVGHQEYVEIQIQVL